MLYIFSVTDGPLGSISAVVLRIQSHKTAEKCKTIFTDGDVTLHQDTIPFRLELRQRVFRRLLCLRAAALSHHNPSKTPPGLQRVC